MTNEIWGILETQRRETSHTRRGSKKIPRGEMTLCRALKNPLKILICDPKVTMGINETGRQALVHSSYSVKALAGQVPQHPTAFHPDVPSPTRVCPLSLAMTFEPGSICLHCLFLSQHRTAFGLPGSLQSQHWWQQGIQAFPNYLWDGLLCSAKWARMPKRALTLNQPEPASVPTPTRLRPAGRSSTWVPAAKGKQVDARLGEAPE